MAQRAARELGGEAEYGDDAPAPGEAVFNRPLGTGASDPVEHVGYRII